MQTAFFPKINGKHTRISFGKILYIEADSNFANIFTIDKKKVCVYNTLGELESKLPEELFCRIHRSYIVSLTKVTEFDRGCIKVRQVELPVSRQYFEKLSKLLIIV